MNKIVKLIELTAAFAADAKKYSRAHIVDPYASDKALELESRLVDVYNALRFFSEQVGAHGVDPRFSERCRAFASDFNAIMDAAE